MKMIYIANARIPTEKAHGLQIMKMCEAFALKNIEVELVAPRRFNKIKQDAFDYYNIKRVFKIKKLPCLDLIPLSIPYLGFWAENITFNVSVFLYLLFNKADLIYSRDLLSLLPMLFHKNIIYEAHYLPDNFWLYKSLLKKVGAIVVITDKLKELYSERGLSANKILVAPDGVDFEQFQISESQAECRQKLNLAPGKKIILYAGHLYDWKGVSVLADAAKYLNSDCLVVFVGGTDKENQEFRIRNKENKNILVVSHRPHAEIPYWLKAADVLVLPNSARTRISKYYTSPLKMFEYMAARKPIVASDLDSIREILNKGNAVLVEPDNKETLAIAIKNVLINYDNSVKISEQAFNDAQKFSWQKRTDNIINFLKFKI